MSPISMVYRRLVLDQIEEITPTQHRHSCIVWVVEILCQYPTPSEVLLHHISSLLAAHQMSYTIKGMI